MGLFDWLGKFKVERNRDGGFSYWETETAFGVNKDLLNISLENFVVMSVISMRAKIYSQMKITHVNENGEEIKDSPFVKLLKQPNYFQSQEDFLFQQMWFQSATGTNLTYQIDALNSPYALYNLIPSEVDLNKTEKISKFITQERDVKILGDKEIIYKLDNQEYRLKLKSIIPSYDLSNGLCKNSFMKSPSRLTSLMPVIHNINEASKSKNVNLKMSQKYLVSSAGDGNNAHIQTSDRTDIERKIGAKSVMITNMKVDAKHLVSDLKRLYLDESNNEDATKVLLAFGMNKEILNYFADGGATYENQEKAMINYIQNDVQASADDRMNSLSSQWGLIDMGEKLVASYDHLPIMASVVNQKIATLKAFEETIKISIESGTITIDEAKQMSRDLRLKLKL